MKSLHIKVPYYSAGQKYGWAKGVPGIGINHEVIKNNDPIRITVGKDKTIYKITRSNFVDNVKAYGSVEYHKGVKIGVVPMNAFEPEDKSISLF